MIWATAEKRLRLTWELLLISFLFLYVELVVIRWLASEIRVFAYFKNLPLMASSLLADQNVKFCRKVADRGHILEKGLIQFEGTMESIWAKEAILSKYLAV